MKTSWSLRLTGSLLISFILTLAPPLWADGASARATCAGDLRSQVLLTPEMRDPDDQEISRRVKKMTKGVDTADPTIPMSVELPNGRVEQRIYFSGHRFITGTSMDGLLRGGDFPVHEVQVIAADGTVMNGPYHTGARGWDGEPVLIDGQRIGFLGLMEMPAPGQLPATFTDNPTRSRHVLHCNFVESNGCYEEVWVDAGPVHGNRPGSRTDWMTFVDGQLVHAHGYGSRLFSMGDQFWRDSNNMPWIAYDRITDATGGLPMITEIFARAFDLKTMRAVGPEVLLLSYKNEFGQPYPATSRGPGAGFLVEGPNPVLINIEGESFWIISFSSGNYVSDQYGTNLAYRRASEGPIGPYKVMTDPRTGDLLNATAKLSLKYGMTWGFARSNLFTHKGLLWGTAHGIPKDSLPAGHVRSGWPTPETYEDYARSLYLIPFKASLVNGRPWIEGVEE